MASVHKVELAKTVVLLFALLGTNNAFAWTWGEVAGEIVKGVVISIIVDAITKPSVAAKEAPLQPSILNPVVDQYSNMKTIAANHFLADSQCNVNAVMSFYSNPVYYEDRDVDVEYIRNTKLAVCRKYSKESYYSIKNNNITVSDFSNDKNIKLIDYDVDFDVFSIQKQRRIAGTTRVRLAIRDDKIIGEFHKKLTNSLSASNIASSARYVCKLDPNGDNFLSLREGPGGTYPEILRMHENTSVTVLKVQGSWLYIKLDNGISGWAFARWIC
ncbi:MAG: hypothetical protein DM484_18955 [Candidatus Methylumidiphilus alinenensis]|uniref:SH3b domain-containing protein n=1 Tax=Candidatus Methylumidiphilus alinenensis TaxID=2202197 RepID=A0A2W4SRK1_9GAMM|nr:MAG: hypothetical protein DM484_18955 [Candidatus Methylumidiphilus alinenensis]